MRGTGVIMLRRLLRCVSARGGTSPVIFAALRYYWITAKGYRLRPWASPYLRWRLETFLGGDMHSLGPVEFFAITWRERAHFSDFLAWTAERRKAQLGSAAGQSSNPAMNHGPERLAENVDL